MLHTLTSSEYNTLVSDIANKVVELISERTTPPYISQRKAYKMYGRGNVDRWNAKGYLTTRKRPGKIEYLTSELKKCQQIEQDYL